MYNILKLFLTPDEDTAIRKRYTDGGMGYKEVKDYLYEKVMTFIKPIQDRYNQITDDEIIAIINESTPKANAIAEKKIEEVYKKVGFIL